MKVNRKFQHKMLTLYFLVIQRRESFLIKILHYMLYFIKYFPYLLTDYATFTIMKGSFGYSGTDYNLFYKYFPPQFNSNIY